MTCFKHSWYGRDGIGDRVCPDAGLTLTVPQTSWFGQWLPSSHKTKEMHSEQAWTGLLSAIVQTWLGLGRMHTAKNSYDAAKATSHSNE